MVGVLHDRERVDAGFEHLVDSRVAKAVKLHCVRQAQFGAHVGPIDTEVLVSDRLGVGLVAMAKEIHRRLRSLDHPPDVVVEPWRERGDTAVMGLRLFLCDDDIAVVNVDVGNLQPPHFLWPDQRIEHKLTQHKVVRILPAEVIRYPGPDVNRDEDTLLWILALRLHRSEGILLCVALLHSP